MSLKTKRILGVNITIEHKKDILEKTRKWLYKVKSQSASWRTKVKSNKEKTLIIYTPNPEIINYACRDREFREIVNAAQINLPDGNGIVWAIKKLYRIRIERISGADFMLDLCHQCEDLGIVAGVIGGRRKLAVETKECLSKIYPKLKIKAINAPEVRITGYELRVASYESRIKNKGDGRCLPAQAGETGDGKDIDKNILNTKYLILNTCGEQEEGTKRYFDALGKEISKHKIGVLFVGLGFPKQELFIENVKCQKPALSRVEGSKVKSEFPYMLMSVGGAFEYITGRVKRAPEWMRNARMEWVYRLIREPWRIGRQIIGSQFFLKVLFER